MVATHDFYPMDPTIWMPIIAVSCVVVKWNVIFFNLMFFLVKCLKFQKMSDWNELSSIVGKWKFYRIYWQWILIEQTSLYTVVYRTFLYNPTNLKAPKKAPCGDCSTGGQLFRAWWVSRGLCQGVVQLLSFGESLFVCIDDGWSTRRNVCFLSNNPLDIEYVF